MNSTAIVFQHIFASGRKKADPTRTSSRAPRLLRGLTGMIRHEILRRKRTGRTYESFACFFAGQGIPEPILRETYRLLARRTALRYALPVEPLDSLREIYDLDCYRGDSLPQTMQAIQRASGLDFCKPVSPFLRCETAADLVYLLAARCQDMYLPAQEVFPFRDAVEGRREK